MIRGKVWKFGDNINTDLIVPGPAIHLPPDEQKRHVFAATRPGWVDMIERGDILVGGKNFGMGSSRPAARSLRNLGAACLLAESIAGLFFRNSVNFGFLALECVGVEAAFNEGQSAEVSIDDWKVRNRETDRVLRIAPVPAPLLALMLNGGIYPFLEKEGLIAAGE